MERRRLHRDGDASQEVGSAYPMEIEKGHTRHRMSAASAMHPRNVGIPGLSAMVIRGEGESVVCCGEDCGLEPPAVACPRPTGRWLGACSSSPRMRDRVGQQQPCWMGQVRHGKRWGLSGRGGGYGKIGTTDVGGGAEFLYLRIV